MDRKQQQRKKKALSENGVGETTRDRKRKMTMTIKMGAH